MKTIKKHINMKKYLLLLAAIIPATVWAVEPIDTLITRNNRKVIVEDTAGTTKVKVLDYDGKEEKMTFEGHYSDQQDVEQYFFSPFIPSKKNGRKHFEASYPAFFFGNNDLASHCFGNLDNLAPHVGGSRSWEWGVTFTTFSFPLDKEKTIGITAAMQLKNVYNHFSGNYILTTDATGKTFVREDANDIQKSYLHYWAFKVPVMFEFQHAMGKFFVSLGCSVEIRSGERSRYKTGGKSHTETKDVNLNPIGLNLESYIGYDDIMLYSNYALTPLLNTHSAPTYYPLTMGIAIKL